MGAAVCLLPLTGDRRSLDFLRFHLSLPGNFFGFAGRAKVDG